MFAKRSVFAGRVVGRVGYFGIVRLGTSHFGIYGRVREAVLARPQGRLAKVSFSAKVSFLAPVYCRLHFIFTTRIIYGSTIVSALVEIAMALRQVASF